MVLFPSQCPWLGPCPWDVGTTLAGSQATALRAAGVTLCGRVLPHAEKDPSAPRCLAGWTLGSTVKKLLGLEGEGADTLRQVLQAGDSTGRGRGGT